MLYAVYFSIFILYFLFHSVYFSIGFFYNCRKAKSCCVIESGWTALAATSSDSRFWPILLWTQGFQVVQEISLIQFVLLILVQTKGRTREFPRLDNLSCGCVS